jgi:hypothetical protein
VKVAVRESAIQGQGLFAIAPIEEGEPIFDDELGDAPAAGQVVMTDEELEAYVATVDEYSARSIGGGRNVVSLERSIVDFGNHSCDPNMWLAPDRSTLIARRGIHPDEELTSDYACWTDSETWSMPCSCGASICRGAIGGKDWQRPELQRAYAGHWPAHLAELIASRPQ